MATRKPAARKPAAPARGPKTIKDHTVELGATGLKHFGGILDEEFNPKLKGKRGREVFQEMSENDPVVGAVLFAIEMLLRQVTWDVDAASDDEQDQANADFLRECMDDLDRPWSEVISEILSMLVYGWQATHPVYKLRRGHGAAVASQHEDGKIGWAKLPTRAQDTIYNWMLSDNGEVEGMVQMAPPTYEVVDIVSERLILFRTTSRKGSPEGRSVLRSAYQPWFFKKKIEVCEAIGIERNLTGMPMAKVPAEYLSSSASAAEKAMVDQLKRLVRNVRLDEQMGVVFPSLRDEQGNEMFTFELLSSSGRTTIDTSSVVDRYNTMIAVTVLADFVLLGQQKVGSFALASSKTEIFATALGAWATSIADTFNRVEVPRLFALNGWSGPLPQIVPGDIEERDLGALGEFLSKMASAGMMLFPDEELERYVRRAAGLPEPLHMDDDEPSAGDGGGAGAGDGDAAAGDVGRTNKLLETVGGIGAIVDLSTAVQQGTMSPDAAVAIMVNVLGLAEDAARKMITAKPVKQPAASKE